MTENERLAEERRLKLQADEMKRIKKPEFFAPVGNAADTPHHADESDFRDSLPEKPEDLAADGFDVSEIESFARMEQAKRVELAALRFVGKYDTRSLEVIAAEIGCSKANLSKRVAAMKERLGMRAHLRSDATREKLRKRTTEFHAKKKAQGGKSLSQKNQLAAV